MSKEKGSASTSPITNQSIENVKISEQKTMKIEGYEDVQLRFATGMNGDEDLGQDITMKGEKFHYNQNMVQFATGMNGDEDLG